MKIALGTDHAGYKMKEVIKAHAMNKGYQVIDFGTDSEEAVDYPDYCRPAAESVAKGECEYGVVFGGSGNGEAMVANKVPGVRCGVCWNVESARLAKEHNNANMIALGERMISLEEGIKIVDAWLNAEFQGGRHQKRIDKIALAERNTC
ncbi:ribose 5-phosphate isomerase B [Desulfopila sp. IMCC35006]|uniref:ribose 5-phosphate isomerase B n=1 Tax=Desulfopila sp. IMCC35006 TaxID=2569542 RepID=UPI0010AB78F5|nr:ribose 5-phosphate isomerase B [Desulfopila sp. IMCC35006]TKB23337.1 ribose 5-phosphate isomerase B [Desulfopila sp. IMCC35006]